MIFSKIFESAISTKTFASNISLRQSNFQRYPSLPGTEISGVQKWYSGEVDQILASQLSYRFWNLLKTALHSNSKWLAPCSVVYLPCCLAYALAAGQMTLKTPSIYATENWSVWIGKMLKAYALPLVSCFLYMRLSPAGPAAPIRMPLSSI